MSPFGNPHFFPFFFLSKKVKLIFLHITKQLSSLFSHKKFNSFHLYKFISHRSIQVYKIQNFKLFSSLFSHFIQNSFFFTLSGQRSRGSPKICEEWRNYTTSCSDHVGCHQLPPQCAAAQAHGATTQRP
jgi:hypothetical protein